MNEEQEQKKVQEIWKKQPTGTPEISMDNILAISKSLKRKVTIRNYVEWLAALIVTGIFLYRAWHAETTWSIFMNLEITLAAIFIGLHVWYRGRYKSRLALDLQSVDFIRSEREQIQKQIKLLSTIKYWYVLPILLGVVGLLSEQIILKWSSSKPPWMDIFRLTAIVLFGIVLSYANEVYGVRKLRRELNRLPEA